MLQQNQSPVNVKTPRAYAYAWKITRNYESAGDSRKPWGPGGLPAEIKSPNDIDWTGAEKFRLLDDDGNIYCAGLHVEGDIDSCACGFGPLDDWGRPNFGCTEIQYLDEKTGEYRTL
jgi:hypothetical protein